jgi:hypothetical protein
VARAIAVEEQVRAYGGPQFQVLQQALDRFSQAVERSGVEIVPRVVFGGGSNGQQGQSYSAFESLMGLLLSEKLGVELSGGTGSSASDENIKRIRDNIMAGLATSASPTDTATTPPATPIMNPLDVPTLGKGSPASQ